MADSVNSTGGYDLLDLPTFITRFGGVDPKDRVLVRLHALFSQKSATTVDGAAQWLEDIVGWLFEWGRVPSRGRNESEVDARTRVLLGALEEVPQARERARRAVKLVAGSTSATRLFTDTGVPSQHAFARELFDRVSRHLLPDPPVGHDLSRLVSRLFSSTRAVRWALELPPATRRRFSDSLGFDDGVFEQTFEPALKEAALLLATRIAMHGCADELRLRLPAESVDQSPWLSLTAVVRDALDKRVTLQVALERMAACKEQLTRIDAALDATGISVDLVFRTELLSVLLTRLKLVLEARLGDEAERDVAWLALERDIIWGTLNDRSVRVLWSSSTVRLARRVVERAGHSGEHYMTRTRLEQHAMFAAAAGGGLVTAFLIIFKFLISWSGLPPLLDALLISTNYATGFVVMQFAHFALATKQPSMTAATLAASIEDQQTSETPDFEPLIDQVARASRTQLAALLGNVGMVLPVAVGLDLLLLLLTGSHFFDSTVADKVIRVHQPLVSGTLYHAAMTGVFLWAASLLAGGVENWFILKELPGAIATNGLLRRVLGAERASRIAVMMTKQISGLGGNIGFGFLIGIVPFLCSLVGFPLQVRHVTFVAGQLAFAGMYKGAAGVLEPDFLEALVSIPLTAMMNFGVSFALALFVALRARGLGLRGQVVLAAAVGRRLLTRPMAFFIAPSDEGAPIEKH